MKMAHPTIQEMVKVGAMTGTLVILQLFLGIIGRYGATSAAVMYIFTFWLSSVLHFHPYGPYPGRVYTRKEFIMYAAADIALAVIGIILWFLVGIASGFERLFTNSYENPSDYFHGVLHGSHFVIRLAYTAISHLTLVSVGETLFNLYHIIVLPSS